MSRAKRAQAVSLWGRKADARNIKGPFITQMQCKGENQQVRLRHRNPDCNVTGNESKRRFNSNSDTGLKDSDIRFRRGAINNLFWKEYVEEEKKKKKNPPPTGITYVVVLLRRPRIKTCMFTNEMVAEDALPSHIGWMRGWGEHVIILTMCVHNFDESWHQAHLSWKSSSFTY